RLPRDMAIDATPTARTPRRGTRDVPGSAGRLASRRARLGSRIRSRSPLWPRFLTDPGKCNPLERTLGRASSVARVRTSVLGPSSSSAGEFGAPRSVGPTGTILAGAVTGTTGHPVGVGESRARVGERGARIPGSLGVLALPRILESYRGSRRPRGSPASGSSRTTDPGTTTHVPEVGTAGELRANAPVLEGPRASCPGVRARESLLGESRPLVGRGSTAFRPRKRGPFRSTPTPPFAEPTLVRRLRG